MQATDISAQEREIRLGDRVINARFDHNMMRQAEMYYQQTTMRRLGFYGIVDQAIARTYSGLGAIAYGASAAAAMAEEKKPLSMQAFDRMFDYEALRAAASDMIFGTLELLPKPKKSGAENGEKNAESQT
ncbi:MAG: hypothetical protein IKK34_14130 [Clostridia bacterium]|nr:hypothetical protein [Clostridia bacterium]